MYMPLATLPPAAFVPSQTTSLLPARSASFRRVFTRLPVMSYTSSRTFCSVGSEKRMVVDGLNGFG